MVAIDTNILVRIATEDDPDQTRRALALLQSETRIFVSKTVWLELEWVLRTTYRLERQRVLGTIGGLLGPGNLDIEDEAAVRRAIDMFAKGLDFADSLHLASAGERQFVTLDRQLQRRARRLGLGDVASP